VAVNWIPRGQRKSFALLMGFVNLPRGVRLMLKRRLSVTHPITTHGDRPVLSIFRYIPQTHSPMQLICRPFIHAIQYAPRRRCPALIPMMLWSSQKPLLLTNTHTYTNLRSEWWKHLLLLTYLHSIQLSIPPREFIHLHGSTLDHKLLLPPE
jgi:hypothetical protein